MKQSENIGSYGLMQDIVNGAGRRSRSTTNYRAFLGTVAGSCPNRGAGTCSDCPSRDRAACGDDQADHQYAEYPGANLLFHYRSSVRSSDLAAVQGGQTGPLQT